MINIDKNLFLQHNKNIIAVTSGVGSMGKTWLAISLAHALNLLRKNVLLFDADNGLLNINAQLGHDDSLLNDVIEEKIALHQAVYSVNKRKFDVISGLSGSNVLESTPLGRLQILCDDLWETAHYYNQVIMDLPCSEKILNTFLTAETKCILVCTKDPSNLVATYSFLQYMAEKYNHKNLQIIINYANSYEEGMQTYNILKRACENFIKHTPSLLGVVRRDTRVRDVIRNNALLFNRYPDCEAAEDIMQIARKLLIQEENNTNE